MADTGSQSLSERLRKTDNNQSIVSNADYPFPLYQHCRIGSRYQRILVTGTRNLAPTSLVQFVRCRVPCRLFASLTVLSGWELFVPVNSFWLLRNSIGLSDQTPDQTSDQTHRMERRKGSCLCGARSCEIEGDFDGGRDYEDENTRSFAERSRSDS